MDTKCKGVVTSDGKMLSKALIDEMLADPMGWAFDRRSGTMKGVLVHGCGTVADIICEIDDMLGPKAAVETFTVTAETCLSYSNAGIEKGGIEQAWVASIVEVR